MANEHPIFTAAIIEEAATAFANRFAEHLRRDRHDAFAASLRSLAHHDMSRMGLLNKGAAK